jgi:hypothetical protein
MFVFKTFKKSFEFEIVLYNKAIDFEIMSNFCIEHLFNLKMFWYPNCRYNGSHISICGNELREHFEF